MIIKGYQLESILKSNNEFLGLLIYGPNEGLVRENISKISKYYTNTHEYEEQYFEGNELDSDPLALDSLLRTVSMFHEGKVVIVNSLKDKHAAKIESFLSNPPSQTILIIKSENLTRSSKIRKLFESDKAYYALACYDEDAKSLIQYINKFLIENDIKLNSDVKNYLMQSLSNDRMLNQHELEKISIFCNSSNIDIKLEDIKYLLNDTSSKNLNKLSENVMFGNASKSSIIISKLLSEGTSPISLIRSLLNYNIRMQATKIEMKKGNTFDNAIKNLKPPVFWKDKDNFQSHCLKWPLKIIEKNLSRLFDTEISCKLNSSLAKLNCSKLILSIANDGKQYFKD